MSETWLHSSNAWKGHKMHQITMLTGLKIHVFTPYSDAFSAFWAHLRKIEFLYSMQTWKELCDKLAIS